MEAQRDLHGVLCILSYIASSLLMALIYCKIRWDFYKKQKIGFLAKLLFLYPYILICDSDYTLKARLLYDSDITRCITFWDYYGYALLRGYNIYFIFLWPLYLLFHWLMALIQWIILFLSWLWFLIKKIPKWIFIILFILSIWLCCY